MNVLLSENMLSHTVAFRTDLSIFLNFVLKSGFKRKSLKNSNLVIAEVNSN